MDGKQKILLLKPYNNVPNNYYAPPLGLLYLAAYLRRNGDADIRIIHLPVARFTYEDLEQEIARYQPDWVGISALSFESRGLHRIASIAKKARPELPVVVGGPYPSSYTAQVMDDANIDYAVIGEGEITIDSLSKVLRTNASVEHIDGLAWRENGRVRINPRTLFIEDVDALPFPAWDLIDLPAYTKYDRMSRIGTRNYTGIFTSRACPFQCIYCHKMFGKGFRKRSPENVLEEIKRLYETFAVREFEVIDDCFNLDLPRAKRIFDLIIDSGMKVRLMFPNGIRGDHLDEEFFEKGRRAGVIYMSFAIETASPRLQKMLRKNVDLQKIADNIALAHKYRIIALGFFMLGFPTETREELQSTINFAIRSKLHAVNFFAVTPFEGTELADMARQMGKPVFNDFDSAFMSSGFVNLTDIPDNELKKIRQRGIVRFWLSPGRMWSLLRDYPDKSRLPHLFFVLCQRVLLKF
jgi:anaerobic magnesium-protoporphyrin IX monomethyl ester cyclase